jgi:membrane-associated protease RseP (regulator of RpoE activity)
MGKLSRTLAISAVVVVLATVAVLWAVSTSGTLAGDESKSLAYSFLSSDRSVFLGVVLEEETEYAEGGARIESVVDDSAADEAGLEAGDIIVAFEGRTIRGPKALTNLLGEKEPGDEVSITVIRDGRERSFDVELGQRTGLLMHSPLGEAFGLVSPMHEMLDCDEDDDCTFSWSCAGDDCENWTVDVGSFFGRRPMLGVQLVHVTDELRLHMGGTENRGVLVSKVVSDSPAEDAGIAVGDLIVAVDGEPVEGAGDIREALVGNEGASFDVEVIRDRRSMHIEVTLPERDNDEPSGPRALRLDGLREHIDRELTDALGAYREALSVARVQRRSAARDAVRRHRDRLNSI